MIYSGLGPTSALSPALILRPLRLTTARLSDLLDSAFSYGLFVYIAPKINDKKPPDIL